MPLEIALLCRTQRLVKKHLHSAMHLRKHANLIGLATTHKQRSIGRLALASQTGYRIQARSLGQKAKLLQGGVEVRSTEIHPHKYGRGGTAFKRWERTQDNFSD